MRFFVFFAILSLAFPVVGEHVSDRLVLGTGITIENVTTKVNDGMVWVTFPDGHMEAYSTEDVDLEASGLIAKENNDSKDKHDPRSMMTKLADAKTPGESSSAFTITDADVEHVVPDAPEEENGRDKKDQGPLIVSGVSHSIVNGRVTVKGTVTNTTSRPISNISVAVVAVGFDGVVGNGIARLPRPLGPKKGTEFSLVMAGSTDFQELKTRARSTSSGGSHRNTTTRPSREPHARHVPRG